MVEIKFCIKLISVRRKRGKKKKNGEKGDTKLNPKSRNSDNGIFHTELFIFSFLFFSLYPFINSKGEPNKTERGLQPQEGRWQRSNKGGNHALTAAERGHAR